MNTSILSGSFHVNLQSVRLLICMTLFYASVKSASCFAVVAFTTSTTVPRFGRTSEIAFARRFGHKTDFAPEDIETFRSRIETLELPEPLSFDNLQELSAQKQQFVHVMQAPVQLSDDGSDKGDELMRDGSKLGPPLEGVGAVPTEGAHPKGAPSDDAFCLLNVAGDLIKSRKVDEKVAGSAAEAKESAAVKVVDSAAKEREVAVVVGSLINVCEHDVESDLRELVNSFLLLAELVARRTSTGNSDPYWAAYLNVLVGSAWTEVGASTCTISAFKDNFSIHQQIVPLLTAAFVPPTPAASILTGIIQGLGDMDATSPWVALFERSATKTDGASLHFSTTSISPDNRLWLDLLSVSLKSDNACFQALFARHTDANARLEIVQKRLETTPRCLRELSAILEEKAAPYKERETARLFKQL